MDEDRARITLRVYTMDDNGHIKVDTGTREYTGSDDAVDRNRNPITFSACTCQGCRTACNRTTT